MTSKRVSAFIHPNLLEGSIIKSILFFAIPILISNIFQQLYNAVDTIIVGHYLKEHSLAAIGACTALFDLFIGFGYGFESGMSLIAARAFGAKNETLIKKVVASAIIITISIIAIITFFTSFFMDDFLRLLSTPEELISEAHSYIIIICLGCGFMFAYNFASGMLRAIGNSFTPLFFLIFSSILNIFLDILFITVLKMGIAGTALATIISQGFSAVLCFIYIFRHTKILIPSIKKGHFVFEAKIYKDLLGQGFSMAFMSSLVASGTVILQSAINKFDTLIIASHTATRKIFSISCTPIFTMGISSATFVSQNYGAKNFTRIKKAIFRIALITTVWSLLLVVTTPFIIKPILAFISGSTNEILINYGYDYLTFAYPFFIILGVLVLSRNALQGLNSKILPLISSFIELVGKIVFTGFIIPELKIRGIILCEPLIWCVMTLFLVTALIKRYNTVSKAAEAKA